MRKRAGAQIELKNITKLYEMGDARVHALDGVSLSIEAGDFVAIMGPSGSGKSTLLHILGLLDVPSSGSYMVEGHEASKLSEDELAVLRRQQIGFVFQQFNLLPRMSALENVTLPLLYSEQQVDVRRGENLLHQVGLPDRKSHRPNELSGGQQQRVAIARALINDPAIILADEPTGNLDSASETEILTALERLNSQGITVIVVTHEEEIARHAKRVIRMRDGAIQSDERTSPLSKHQGEVPEEKPAKSVRAGLLPFIEVVEHFRQGFKTLGANKVRTGLSMLGILIGVAAVVAMLALGRGAQKAIESQLASLGSNLLVLSPGALRVGGVAHESGTTTRLTIEDSIAIQSQIPNVKAVAPNVSDRGQTGFGNKNWNTQILGSTPSYANIRAAVPEVGRFFTAIEDRARARVAVVGTTIVRELFGSQNPIGEMIKINKVNFQIVGILPEKGAAGWHDQDDIIVIPILTAMHRLMGKVYVDRIDVEMEPASDMDRASDSIIDLMNVRHRVPLSQREEAYQIRNMADIQAAVSSSSQTMGALLASIAAISLLVGGIGIMNIMLVSVTERTREIGLRKAVGACRNDILSQFLIESMVVSVIGGVAGIILGWTISTVLSSAAGWATSVSPGAVFLAFFFSASIGVVFGIYPARKASMLAPIDALRYE